MIRPGIISFVFTARRCYQHWYPPASVSSLYSYSSSIQPSIQSGHKTNSMELSAAGGGRGRGRRGRGGGRGIVNSHRRRLNTSNNTQQRRGGRGRRKAESPSIPSPGTSGCECHRSCISAGMNVYVVKKEDQRSGRETIGTVSRLLTKSSYHPRGIKVMLTNGVVGRVTRFPDDNIPRNDNDNIQKKKKRSLTDYLKEEEVDKHLSRVIEAAAAACSQVANELRSLPMLDDINEDSGGINVQGEEQKGMDVRANIIFLQKLNPVVASMVSEEEDIVVGTNGDMKYSIAFDPLDGSSNLDITSPTGSIFGIYRHKNNGANGSCFEIPARSSLVAAGYTVYSSATELVLAGIGKGVVGFSLDIEDDTFRCSRPNMVCPDRGPYYSLNEAREPDWPSGLRRWITDAKRGQTPSGYKYSARYVCSLTADVHRTLLKGGWAGNPRPHLRLLYESAPLAFILESAGGKGVDGVSNLLDIKPNSLHHRVSTFLGSKFDIDDLEAYGSIQQNSKSYDS